MSYHAGLLGKLVEKLYATGFICDGMNYSDHSGSSTGHHADSFMGICRHPKYTHHRRIDIKVYSFQVHAFGLVHFTGNDILNRRIRYHATLLGYTLSDRGLFPSCGSGDTHLLQLPKH
eukprot:TRINITY_DN23725_c0_g1_i1.p1 TRINITY_DN23725_c0_g1~~TRINITY_DN23725_c0_g1_i1.p1  ORF type:complete len:136 (+),score=6.31 TRINITY_DN23725_c0_g1_i1:55-408(+)